MLFSYLTSESETQASSVGLSRGHERIEQPRPDGGQVYRTIVQDCDVDPFIDFPKVDLHLRHASRTCHSLAGIEQQVIYGTFKIPRIYVCFRRRKLASCNGNVPTVWMKLHRRNGFLNNLGHALMDERIFLSVTTELQERINALRYREHCFLNF